MICKAPTPRVEARQRGAALIVGLIMLLVLTLLGVSTMNTATVELAMASNSQQSQYAFQAAESGLSAELIQGGTIMVNAGTVRGTQVRPDGVYNYVPGANHTANAVVNTQYQTMSLCANSAWEWNSAWGANRAFACRHFAMQATGTANRGARSSQIVGFYIPAPQP